MAAPGSPPPPGLSFPTNPQDFDSDDRISFSKLDNKFVAVHDDGTEFEFDNQLKRWIPAIDEELIAQQQQAYGGGRYASEEAENSGAQRNNRRRRRDDDGGPPQHKKQKKPAQPRQNTAVYVTGLPLDATADEIHDVFSRKCGVVAEEIDSGRPRIKLYEDESGNFKGDALVVFFKPQSVEMAIMLLDDTDFRYTPSGLKSGRMSVQAADSSYKKTNYDKEDEGAGGEGAGSTNNGQGASNREQQATAKSAAASDRRAREQDKQKIIKRTQKLDARLADWDDDDPYGGQLETNLVRPKLVILSHMFTLQELDEDPAALLEIKEDIRDECSKLGQVTNVVLYDLEENGVASVRFRDADSAAACVERMDGRAFDGRTVRAHLASGKERYKKSGKKDGGDEDDEDNDG